MCRLLLFMRSDFAMIGTRTLRWGACLLVGSALAQFATPASAQFFGNGQLPNNGNNALPIFPMQGQSSLSNLTPQQLQSLMMMRAMSGIGRHGVQTGFPQNIPLGNGLGGAPVLSQSPITSESQATHKSSAQKRADARKLREDQKHAVRQDEKSKKTKAAKKARGDDQQQAAK
jgi:hypothetical protein